nr:reverse transcriptase domain-containing protein [Tanacetum cinerariifolium]
MEVEIECCMCGDVGFSDKIFRCNNCRHRYEHSWDYLKPPKMSAASCAGSYEKPKGYLADKKEAINNNSGSQTNSLGPETKLYSDGKASLSLVFAAKRLRRYFQAHPIAVITDQPINQIMSRPDVAGRLHKWSVILGEHNITYRPRTSVKGQILADFLTEMPDENPPAAPVAETQQESWTLFTDGSSCVDGSSAGLIL